MGSGCESNWRKIIGKPYAGKLHVRFDEGELEIGPSATTPVLYSTVMLCSAGSSRGIDKEGGFPFRPLLEYRASFAPKVPRLFSHQHLFTNTFYILSFVTSYRKNRQKNGREFYFARYLLHR
jgi:hypothetical protein